MLVLAVELFSSMLERPGVTIISDDKWTFPLFSKELPYNHPIWYHRPRSRRLCVLVPEHRLR